MVNLGALPEPILTPFPRRRRTELKPAAKPAGNETAAPPQKPQETAAAPGNGPEKTKPQASKPVQIDVEVIANGTEIPLPFRTVSPLDALSSENPSLALLMLRQLKDMSGPMPDTSNGALSVIERLQAALRRGEDVSHLSAEIAVFLTGQSERRELIDALESAHDDERKIEIMKSIAGFEDFVNGCLRRKELNIVQGIAAVNFLNGQMRDILSKRSKRGSAGIAAEVTSTREPSELVKAISLPAQNEKRELLQKFEEASPSEREILRKLGFKIERGLKAARITKTTTETVEVVNQDGPGPSE